MFERKGVFLVPAKHVDENTLYSAAIDAGADDVKLVGESYEVLSTPESIHTESEALEAARIPVEVGEIQRVPSSTVDLDAGTSRRMLKLIEALEDQDDVQSVTANYNIPDEIMAEAMSGA
jgi:transcriptional/translational regulatory protein YebC/TACO1